jgi:hypothetical protein
VQRFRVPGSRYRIRCPAFGPRPSAWTKDAGKVVSPLPLILPWPRVGYRAPRTEPEGRVPGTWDPGPAIGSTPRTEDRACRHSHYGGQVRYHPTSWSRSPRTFLDNPYSLTPVIPRAKDNGVRNGALLSHGRTADGSRPSGPKRSPSFLSGRIGRIEDQPLKPLDGLLDPSNGQDAKVGRRRTRGSGWRRKTSLDTQTG